MIVQELISLVGFKLDEAVMNRASNAVRNFGSKMQSVGRTMSMALTLPIAGLGISMLKIAGDFEASMNILQVKTSATADELAKLRQQARDLGATTAFSAKEAGDGMVFLAQAGFSVNEIFEAMPHVLNLAGAAGADLATTADQVSNIMTALKIDTSETGHVTDVLAATASATNTSISQLSEAFRFAAPDAESLGVSLEQLAALMGFMANAGVQGSMSGTNLRMALNSIIKPSDDAKASLKKLNVELYKGDKVRNIVDILQDLQDAEATPLDLLNIFGIRAKTGTGVVIGQTIDSLKDFVRQLEKFVEGTALRENEARMKGLNGTILALKSAYAELAIAIFDAGLLEDTTKGAQKLTDLLRELSKADPERLKLIAKITALVVAIPVALIGLGALTSAIAVIIASPEIAILAALVTGLVVLGGFVYRSKPTGDGTETPTYAQQITDNPLGIFGSTPAGTHRNVMALTQPGAFFGLNNKDKQLVSINNETNVNFNGQGSLTTGEISETISRTLEERDSKLQHDLRVQ